MSSENISHAKSQTRMMLGKQPESFFLWPKIRLHSKYAELFTLCHPVSIKLKNSITSETFCF